MSRLMPSAGQFGLILLGLSLLLCAAAYAYGDYRDGVIASGTEVMWRQVPVPTSAEFQLHSTTWAHIIYIVRNDQLFECDPNDLECNRVDRERLPEPSAYQPCDVSTVAFSATNVPANIESCHYVQLDGEASDDTYTVIDQSGQVWVWANYALGGLTFPLSTAYALMAGMFGLATLTLFGTTLFILRWLNNKESHAITTL